MLFPSPLRPGEEFELEQVHVWPVGMTEGEDTLWYPYTALFDRPSRSLLVEVSFDRALRYILALQACLDSAKCKVATTQPTVLNRERTRLSWRLDPVDNETIYGLVFEREPRPMSDIDPELAVS